MHLSLLYCIPFILIHSIGKHCYALNVLISAPNFFPSHLWMHSAIADLLVKEGGHELTFLVSIWNFDSGIPPVHHSENWTLSQTVIRHSPSSPKQIEAIRQSIKALPTDNGNIWRERGDELFSAQTLPHYTNIIDTSCKAMHLSSDLFSSLGSRHFDVAISEWFDYSSLALFHRLRIPATLITSAIPLNSITARYLGLPMPAYIPDVNTAPPEGTKMGIWRRMTNYFQTRQSDAQMEKIIQSAYRNVLIPHFGSDFPSPKELMLRSSFLLLNTNAHLELARPLSTKIIHIGGFLLHPDHPTSSAVDSLNGEAKELLERRSVLVSFGSVADPNKMSRQMLHSFFAAFDAFPEFTFIWKFPSQKNGSKQMINGERIPPNVHLFSWIDQRSFFAHPNLRAFVSHCGLNSLNEAAFEGVPILCIPLFGDQNYNGAIVGQHGNGIVLQKENVRTETLKGALEALLALGRDAEGIHNKYVQRAKVISRKMRMSPNNPRNMILRLVEYAAEFGGQFDELNLEGAKMGEWAQNGWDFLVPIGILLIGGTLAGGKICEILVRKLFIKSDKEN